MRTALPTRRRMFFPWGETEGMENRLDKLFDEPFFAPAFPATTAWVPSVDVAETDDALILTAELPGMNEEDVEIELEGNVLTLRGEKKEEVEEEAGGERRMRIWERRYGEFTRAFTVPTTVDADQIVAEFENGILTIHLPKTLEAKGRRIQIKAG